MNPSARMLVAFAAVPMLAASAMGVAVAAADPSATVITSLDAQYVGPQSSAGRTPTVQVEATQVARAFADMVTYKTVRKVVKATDGKAIKKGTVVTTQGYRCKATTFKLINPGTAGEYAKVTWKCTFVGADTATRIALTYKQASL